MINNLKKYFPLIVLLIILGISCWAWIFYDLDSYAQTKNILSFLTIFASLAVFYELFITIRQFRETKVVEMKQKKDKFIARRNTLIKEIEVNLMLCDEIIGVAEGAVPSARYYFKIVEQTLSSGHFPEREIRNLLWNAYHNMTIANDLLACAVEVRFYEHIADPRDQLSREGRNQRIAELVEKSKHLSSLVKNSMLPPLLAHLNSLSPPTHL